METITLEDGARYAKVATRVASLHDRNECCNIETSYEFAENLVIFAAKVTIGTYVFTGHSMGRIDEPKSFEKLETIAVGRALAFAGYLASGEIACAEEMDDVVTSMQLRSLQLKHATVFADQLKGLDRPTRQQAFDTWCRDIVGENADYGSPRSWNRSWYNTCWQHLAGGDVPFEE